MTVFASTCAAPSRAVADDLERIEYNQPGLVVDLGVGLWAWPLPMDFDGDGDMDLLVACPDKPSNGLYFFENVDGNVASPVFRSAKRLGPAPSNVCVSAVGGRTELLTPGRRHPEFPTQGIGAGDLLPVPADFAGGKLRANQWKHCDFDGDGATDLVVGVEDWQEYGWDDAYDDQGRWTNGPLHGYVYVLRNEATDDAPRYAAPRRLQAGGNDIDVYGMPSPSFADFDGDGDLDLVCGEFLDGLTYFENVGDRKAPNYAAGQRIVIDGQPLRFELCMIVPTAVDWEQDGDVDLVVGHEDGRVTLVENAGAAVDGQPRFLPPRYFQQQADDVKIGALATPTSVDWDGDGDEDLICGDTAGFLSFVENVDGAAKPRLAPPVRLLVNGRPIRIQAGSNGSIQGPCEAKWGYTVPQAADWDHDGLVDLVINSIWGKVQWYRNTGMPTAPQLSGPYDIEVAWPDAPPRPEWTWWTPSPTQLATQWRTTPYVIDLDQDGLNDLVMLDPEGYLAFYRRMRSADGQLMLAPPERAFKNADGAPLQLNSGRAGKSGRRKFVLVDWDGDGRRDLVVDSRPNIDLWRNIGTGDEWRFEKSGPLAERLLCGHSCCPTVVDWDRNGVGDLVVGAEDGHLYFFTGPERP